MLWGLKSRSAADSSLKQPVDSRGANPQGPDIRRCVMTTPCRHSECLPVGQESAANPLMGPGVIKIGDVLSDDTTEMALTQNEDMIQAPTARIQASGRV